MLNFKKTFTKLFRKNKEVLLTKSNSSTKFLTEEQTINDKINSTSVLRVNKDIILSPEQYYTTDKDFTKVRLKAFNHVSKEFISAPGIYDESIGLITGIVGENLSLLSDLERLTWSSSTTSSNIYYGYSDIATGNLFSSTYIINFIQEKLNANSNIHIKYSKLNKTISINYSSCDDNNTLGIRVFSICGLVKLEEELNKIGMLLIRS